MTTYKNDYMSKIDISQSFLNDRCEIGPKYKIKTSDIFDSYVDYCKEHDIAMVKRAKFYESLTNKKILTKRIRGIDFYSIRLKNNHVEDDVDCVDELEYGIDKVDVVKVDVVKVDITIKADVVKADVVKADVVKAVTIDAKELLIKQLQAKQITDDIAFEQEDIEIKKIIKEQNTVIKQIRKSYSDLDYDTVIVSTSKSDSDCDSYSDSESDSNSDSDSEINEIGDEDYSFLVNF